MRAARFAINALPLALCLSMPAAAQTVLDPRLVVEPVAAGLELPTAIAFLGADDFLVCEKNSGRIKHVVSGAVADVALDLPVNGEATRGLLGLAKHPDFDANGFLYVFYSRAAQDGGAWIENRLSRFAWDGDRILASSEQTLAVFPAAADQNNAPACEGGHLRFGPDGLLYGTLGDLGRGGFDNPRIETNTADAGVAHGGGIFRLRDDGAAPADNPFAAHASPEIQRLFAFGVRNSFGLAWDPYSGALWDAENGPEVYDEINLVRPGMNSGWLKLMGPDARDATYEQNLDTPFDQTDLIELPGAHYADPALSFYEPLGVTSLAFVDGPRFPCDLRGALLLGDFNFGQLYIFRLNAQRDGLDLPPLVSDGVADTPEERAAFVFGEGWGVTTALEYGPDQALYHVSMTHGAVRRIRQVGPAGDVNFDGVVDLADVLLTLGSFGRTSQADTDCDGDTDLIDLATVLGGL